MQRNKPLSGVKYRRFYYLLTALALMLGHLSYSQCSTLIPTNMNCATYHEVCSGTDFIDTCNSTSGWSPSHGTPQLVQSSQTQTQKGGPTIIFKCWRNLTVAKGSFILILLSTVKPI